MKGYPLLWIKLLELNEIGMKGIRGSNLDLEDCVCDWSGVDWLEDVLYLAGTQVAERGHVRMGFELE